MEGLRKLRGMVVFPAERTTRGYSCCTGDHADYAAHLAYTTLYATTPCRPEATRALLQFHGHPRFFTQRVQSTKYGIKYGFCSSNFPYGLGKYSLFWYFGPFGSCKANAAQMAVYLNRWPQDRLQNIMILSIGTPTKVPWKTSISQYRVNPRPENGNRSASTPLLRLWKKERL